jgi:hypothetical protein
MRKPTTAGWLKKLIFALLLLTGGRVAAQSAADQSFKNLPQNVKESAENKATTKTNTVSNNAMNKLDSASNKAFKGITGIFKKKKKPATDSTRQHATDTTAIPVAVPPVPPKQE